jgi:hypothetical protein
MVRWIGWGKEKEAGELKAEESSIDPDGCHHDSYKLLSTSLPIAMNRLKGERLQPKIPKVV